MKPSVDNGMCTTYRCINNCAVFKRENPNGTTTYFNAHGPEETPIRITANAVRYCKPRKSNG